MQFESECPGTVSLNRLPVSAIILMQLLCASLPRVGTGKQREPESLCAQENGYQQAHPKRRVANCVLDESLLTQTVRLRVAFPGEPPQACMARLGGGNSAAIHKV